MGAALATTVGLQLPNSRTQEAEADRIGIELAALIPEVMPYYEDKSPRPVCINSRLLMPVGGAGGGLVRSGWRVAISAPLSIATAAGLWTILWVKGVVFAGFPATPTT